MTDGVRRRPSRLRAAHPLLNPFPVIVMSLAAFLVAFALLAASGPGGSVPAAGSPTSSYDARQAGGGTLRTRASGATVAVAGSAQIRRAAPAVTRTSVRGEGDDA